LVTPYSVTPSPIWTPGEPTGASAPLLGVIANGFKSGRRGGYGYGYGYDYTPAKPEPLPDTPASPNGAAAAEAPPVPSTNG
jgi:hypothetical protein